jgi:N,N'-diacetylchitobiose transport system permease protein
MSRTTAPAGAPTIKSVKPRRNIAPYLLITPAVAILIVALAYPMGWQIMTSFKQFGLAQQFGTAPAPFVGLENYIEIVTTSTTWGVVLRSIAFCLANAGITVVLGALLALLMNAIAKAPRLILQVGLLLAWAMPVVAVMTVWNWLFDWKNGAINWILAKLGFDGMVGHNWLANPWSFYLVATIIVVWMSVPFVAFSIYAGLTQVSPEVLEAAEMDGTSRSQRFWLIIVPMVRPVIMIVLLLQIIWDLRVFSQIRMLQDRGSTPSETNLLGTFIYEEGVRAGNFGMASAMSVFVLILTIAMSAFYVRSLMKEDQS